MYFEIIKGLLPRRETKQVIELSKRMTFIDGRASSNPGSQVKNNLQCDIQDPVYAEAGKIVQRAIYRSQAYKDYTLPRSMGMPMVCKYEVGMEYGFHVDAAVLATKPPIRADVATTVFLSDPDSYDGGELVAKLGDKNVEIKLNPGDAVVYPSLTLHRVNPVTRGVRLVSITFAESLVKDHYQRELLYQLGKAIDKESEKLSFDTMTELTNVHTNLQRYWMER